MNAQIDENTNLIKANASEYEQQKFNIGNYTQSIIEAYQELEKQKTALVQTESALRSETDALIAQRDSLDKNSIEYANLTKTIGIYTTQLKSVSNEIDAVSVAMAKATGEEQTNAKVTEALETKTMSLREQMRLAKLAVIEMSEAYGVSSREAIEAAKVAGELADRIGDAKTLVDAFNPDARFKAVTASLSGVAGGFGAVEGAMNLLGTESEDVQKALLRVQSAMAISQGLQDVGESIDSFKQLGAVLKDTAVIGQFWNFVQTGSLRTQKEAIATTVLQAEAEIGLAESTAVATTATTASSSAMKIFRLALISTGIGAIVVGLGLLVANFDKIKEVVLNAVPGLKKVGDIFGSIVNAVTDFVGATSDATRALDKLKKEADRTLSINKKFMQEHGDQLDDYTKRKLDAKNAYAEAVKQDGADQVALAKRLNRELAKADSDRSLENAKKREDESKKQIDASKKARDEQNKLRDEINKKAEEEAKKQIEIQKQLSDEAIKIASDTFSIKNDFAKRE